jgi:hypothetical protein
LLLTLVASVVACESYDLEVQNKTDDVVDIYIDEFYEGAIAPNNYLLIRNLSEGEHYIEAIDFDGDAMVEDSIWLDGDSKWIIYETYYRLD